MSIARKVFRLVILVLLPFQIMTSSSLAGEFKLIDIWNWVEKWQFDNVTGLFHDIDGNLYTVDRNLCLVNKYNPSGDLLLRFGSCGTDNGQFKYPAGIAVDSFDYIYVSDTRNTRIQKFNSQGGFVQSWPMPKDGRPYDIDVDAADSIYVASDLTAKVYKFSPSGTLQRIFGDDTGPGHISNPRGVCVAPNGDVYVSDDGYSVGSILRFDKDGLFISRFGDNNALPGYIGMGSPGGMSLMGNSVVVALDNLLFRYAFNGTFIEELGEYGLEDHQFRRLNDVSVGPTGTVVVGSRMPRVQLFINSPWTFVAAWKSASKTPGFFDGPVDFAFGPDGVVYVADAENDRIQKFTSNGYYLDSWGSSGSSHGQFNLPYSLDVDEQGNVYVSDFLNYRIQKFDANGNFIKAWGSQGSGYVEFEGIKKLRFGPDGNLYTLDSGNHRIQIFNKNGDFVNMWGTAGSEEGELTWPDALAIDKQGNLFISDYYKRIQKFTAQGLFVDQFTDFMDVHSSERFEDLTFDSDGILLALKFDLYQQKILTIDPVGGNVLSSFGETGIEPGRFFGAIALRATADGRLFVGEAGANRVQVFQMDNGKFWTLMMPAILSNSNKQ